MQVQAADLCTGLKRLAHVMSTIDAGEVRKKALARQQKLKKGAKLPKRPYPEVIACDCNLDHITVQTYTAIVRRLTEGEP